MIISLNQQRIKKSTHPTRQREGIKEEHKLTGLVLGERKPLMKRALTADKATPLPIARNPIRSTSNRSRTTGIKENRENAERERWDLGRSRKDR